MPDIEETLERLAYHIEHKIPAGWFFVLVIGSTGPGPKYVHYVSNMENDAQANRLLQEFIEKGPLPPPPT